MKNHTKYYFFPLKICLLLLTFLIFFSNGETFAQEKKKKKKTKHWEIKFELSTIYDNNILKYSDKYLDRFMNGQDSARFVWINTYDDLILNPSIEGSYTFNIFKKLETKINAYISPKIYVVNEHKNWYNWGVGLTQDITKKASVKILYSYIPNFYVRHFRDDQWIDVYGYTPETFTPYEFSKDNFGIYAQNTFFKSTRIRLSLYYARYYHNKHYTEYDSKDWLYGINIYQGITKNLKLDFGYQFVTSDAKGYDSSVETPETTTGPDATFEEDRFTFGIFWRLPKLKKHSNNLEFDFAMLYRYYSSPYRPIQDPLHVGRVDKNYRVLITYNIYLIRSFKLSLFYNWLMRDTDTKAKINSLYVSNEKDYRQDRIGFTLEYKLRF